MRKFMYEFKMALIRLIKKIRGQYISDSDKMSWESRQKIDRLVDFANKGGENGK